MERCYPSKKASSNRAIQPQHDYHDYSQIEEYHFPLVGLCVPSPPDSGSAFPVRFHYVLSELERDGDTSIIAFQSHGRCFVIRNKERLLKEILPKWFRQTQISSFRRQLSLYGFKRITAPGPDQGGYYHECFLRGKPFLAHFIKYRKVNGRGKRASASPGTEPNFYLMRTCGTRGDGSVVHPTLPPCSVEEEAGEKSTSRTEVGLLRPLASKSHQPVCIVRQAMQNDQYYLPRAWNQCPSSQSSSIRACQTSGQEEGGGIRASSIIIGQEAPTEVLLRQLTSALHSQICKEEALLAAMTRSCSLSHLPHESFSRGEKQAPNGS